MKLKTYMNMCINHTSNNVQNNLKAIRNHHFINKDASELKPIVQFIFVQYCIIHILYSIIYFTS